MPYWLLSGLRHSRRLVRLWAWWLTMIYSWFTMLVSDLAKNIDIHTNPYAVPNLSLIWWLSLEGRWMMMLTLSTKDSNFPQLSTFHTGKLWKVEGQDHEEPKPIMGSLSLSSIILCSYVPDHYRPVGQTQNSVPGICSRVYENTATFNKA